MIVLGTLNKELVSNLVPVLTDEITCRSEELRIKQCVWFGQQEPSMILKIISAMSYFQDDCTRRRCRFNSRAL